MHPTMGSWSARAAALVILVAGTLFAQPKQVTIPDTTGKQGDTLLIPIRVGALAASDSVYAGQFTLTYNSADITVYDVQTTGALLDGFGTVQFNPTSRTIAFAGSAPLTGSGVLIYLKTALIGPPGVTSSLTLPSGTFNETKPSYTVTGGSVRILAITLSPKTPPTVSVGDTVQFSVSGDKVLPVVWSSSDTTVGSIGANGRMAALKAGTLRISVRDAQGLRDSSTLFGIYTVQAKSLTIATHDTSYTQTLFFNLPVYISDVTGLGIVSAQFSLTYNASLLQAVSLVQANTKSAGWTASPPNITSGRVDVALAGADSLSGAGILIYVRFRVQNSASGSTSVAPSSVLFNENLLASTVNGTFTALAAPTVVINPATATVTKGDTLRFKVTSGGRAPFTWSTTVPGVASIDAGGLLTALAEGTTAVTVVDSFGFIGTSGVITVNDFRVSIPDTAMGLADSIDVPIFTGDLTALNIFSFESRIVYDSTIVRYSSIVASGTLSNNFTISARDTLDTLRVAAAGSQALSGGGILLKVRFRTKTGSTGVSSPLKLAAFKFNEGEPSATTHDGSISIVAAPLAPTLVSPADNATSQATNLSLSWNAAAGATSYRLQISTSNTFATTNVDSSGISLTLFNVHGLSTSTTYFWRVSGRNLGGQGPYSATRQFTTGTTAVDLVSPGIPTEFGLEQNYPNPFNPATSIRFSIPAQSDVRLRVFSIAGVQVASLVSGELEPGLYQVTFHAQSLSSGVYFYLLEANRVDVNSQPAFRSVMKMILLK